MRGRRGRGRNPGTPDGTFSLILRILSIERAHRKRLELENREATRGKRSRPGLPASKNKPYAAAMLASSSKEE